jgi:UDP-MurNAc hydroxylase
VVRVDRRPGGGVAVARRGGVVVKIEWVNHAAFVVESGGVRLMSDPWLEGRAFDDGWAHLAPTLFRFDDFASITHVWFSHEHPDHFSPANLRKIPETARRKITVLYQKTRDRKVVDFCRKAGFADVVELPTAKWFRVADGFDVLCRPLDNGDSWLAVRTPDATLVNLNDCIVRTKAQCDAIRALVARDVDVLFTQFSYASWPGNPDDRAARRRAADEKLDRVRLQATSLRPRCVVPFASYVWFCHEENVFHNDGANRVGDAHAAVEALGVRSVVLYPGDTWDVGAEHLSGASIERYRPHYERVAASPELVKSTPVDVATLQARADEFRARLLRKNGALFRLARRRSPFPPARIRIADHDVVAEFTLERGLVLSPKSDRPCDIEVASEALSYCFQHEWGGGTLQVNGRYRAPAGGDVARFHLYFELAEENNRGVTYPSLLARRLLARVGGRGTAT